MQDFLLASGADSDEADVLRPVNKDRAPMCDKGFYCLAADIALIKNCSVAEVILKDSAMDFSLPDDTSRAIVAECLYPGNSVAMEGRIKATLHSVFSQAFSSVEEGRSLLGMNEILHYAMACSIGHRTIPHNEESIPIFAALFSAMDMVVLRLKTVAEQQETADDKAEYRRIADWANTMLAYSKKKNGVLDRACLYQIIMSAWETLKDMPCTYSALASLILLQDSFDDGASARYELFGLLKYCSFS